MLHPLQVVKEGVGIVITGDQGFKQAFILTDKVNNFRSNSLMLLLSAKKIKRQGTKKAIAITYDRLNFSVLL